jgi:hypothetical protein
MFEQHQDQVTKGNTMIIKSWYNTSSDINLNEYKNQRSQRFFLWTGKKKREGSLDTKTPPWPNVMDQPLGDERIHVGRIEGSLKTTPSKLRIKSHEENQQVRLEEFIQEL